jgi:hypothetical protein
MTGRKDDSVNNTGITLVFTPKQKHGNKKSKSNPSNFYSSTTYTIAHILIALIIFSCYGSMTVSVLFFSYSQKIYHPKY